MFYDCLVRLMLERITSCDEIKLYKLYIYDHGYIVLLTSESALFVDVLCVTLRNRVTSRTYIMWSQDVVRYDLVLLCGISMKEVNF